MAEDIFREIGTIGAGSSMASLAHMIGREMRCSSPVILKMEYDEMADWFGLADESVVGVLIPFTGDIRGMLLQIYRKNVVKVILEGLLDRELNQGEMDGSFLELLRETANIMASSYLTAVAVYSDCRVQVLGSAVSMDMAGSIFTEFCGTAISFGDVCCIGSRFCEREGNRESCMLLVLPKKAEQYFVKALGVQV